jgi:nitrate reductase molybdenum cofactor assembly chaperone NarJ/NarW
VKLRNRVRDATLCDRVVWQAASLLLAYPDDGHPGRLQTVAELLEHVPGPTLDPLARCLNAQRALVPRQAAESYVATFDLSKRTTMYLTYWTAGDTRNRGVAMHAFVAAYLDAGVRPPESEAPDHLPVVLEFAATVDPVVGRRLLAEHRVPIDVLFDALVEAGSPYADAVAAVRATLPSPTGQDIARANRLVQAGPPAEAVGLQPFTLTVPPRRTEGVH